METSVSQLLKMHGLSRQNGACWVIRITCKCYRNEITDFEVRVKSYCADLRGKIYHLSKGFFLLHQIKVTFSFKRV